MSKTTITLSAAALALVKSDVTGELGAGKRYATYVAEANVTAETKSAHVAIFRDAYRKSSAAALKRAEKAYAADETPENKAAFIVAETLASEANVKAYATKVRNGLGYWIDGAAKKKSTPTALLTTLGKAATREEVIAAWEAAQS